MAVQENNTIELIRYFLVALFGLILDLGVSWTCIEIANTSDPSAATVGLFAGMMFNYFAHLNWTFREHQEKVSIAHFTKFSIVVAFTLLIRVLILESIRHLNMQEMIHPVARLTIAAGGAFIFSYILCKAFIFKKCNCKESP